MEIIEEIRREKELRKQQAAMVKEMKQKKHGEEIKGQAAEYKNTKDEERQRQIRENAIREQERERQLQKQIKDNQPKVQNRQLEQAAKIAERTEMLARKANEMVERQ